MECQSTHFHPCLKLFTYQIYHKKKSPNFWRSGFFSCFARENHVFVRLKTSHRLAFRDLEVFNTVPWPAEGIGDGTRFRHGMKFEGMFPKNRDKWMLVAKLSCFFKS